MSTQADCTLLWRSSPAMRYFANRPERQLAALTLSFCLLCLPTQAQPGGGPPSGGSPGSAQQGQPGGGPVEELTQLLKLTPTQQEQLRQIFERNRPPRPNDKPSDSSDSKGSSSRRHSSSTSSSSRSQTGKEGNAAKRPSASHMARLEQEIEAILTPEQKKLFSEWKAQRKSQGPPPGSRNGE